LTTADDLREDPLAFLCPSQAAVARVVTLQTSGTTRAPKRIFFSGSDLETNLDFFHHGMTTLAKPGDRVLILLPGERPDNVGDLLRRALARMDAQGIVADPGTDAGTLPGDMVRSPVDAVVGMPLQVLALARLAGAMGTQSPRSVLLTGDTVPRAVVTALRRIWRCQVCQHYGMTETGLGGGVECAAMDGCHLREADLYVEIIDPHTGQQTAPGTIGEIVITTLAREAMPLVRYRTGDLGRLIDAPCPCGSVLRRLQPVHGRLRGRFRLGPDPDLSLADLDEAVLPLPSVVGLTARLVRKPGRDQLQVTVRTVPGAAPPDLAQRADRALATLPVLARAAGAGFITLAPVRMDEQPVGAWDLMTKRNLIDQRKDHEP
jgi:phenylacetate-coenzyme A ligase PaaK-like adenylate-forming protein